MMVGGVDGVPGVEPKLKVVTPIGHITATANGGTVGGIDAVGGFGPGTGGVG